MEFVFELEPSEKEMAFLDQKLVDFNRSKVENYTYENFIIKTMGSSGTITAGIHGQVEGGWLYIASLWVAENYRGRGLGKELLFRAEKTGSEKNCQGIYLYTYSFQAPEYYEKFGYRIFGKLENFRGSHTKYYMKKILT